MRVGAECGVTAPVTGAANRQTERKCVKAEAYVDCIPRLSQFADTRGVSARVRCVLSCPVSCRTEQRRHT
eukprot:4977570-Prymnesium_polylepis.1